MSSPFCFAFCSEIRNACSHRPRPKIFHLDWIYLKRSEPGDSRLVYVKHTFSTNCILQRTSRLHQMHTLKIKCRLVYTKCLFFLESDVWSPPNAYLGKQVRDRAQTRVWLSGEIIGNAFCKVASRLRKTHTFKKRHFAPRVSSTPNAHSKNQVSSRLHQMLPFLQKVCLARTKRLLWKQNRAEPGHSSLVSLFEYFLYCFYKKTDFTQSYCCPMSPSARHPPPCFVCSVVFRFVLQPQ